MKTNTIIIIIIVICVLCSSSSSVAGGIGANMFYKNSVKERGEKLLEDETFYAFYNCNYTGQGDYVYKFDENADEDEVAFTTDSDSLMIKSLIVPNGVTVNTYERGGYEGDPVIYKGPTAIPCDMKIKSFIVKKDE